MTEQNQPVEEETVTPEADTVQPEPQEPPTYEELQARIAELEGQLKDSELRGLANEQNLRRRHQQEIADTHKFAGQKFAAEMLPVKDYLEMALLDQSVSEQEPNTIVSVMKKGYTLSDRVLRPAMVIVAKKEA